MGRISDVNRARKLEYAQAILLGVTFRHAHASHRLRNGYVEREWRTEMPSWFTAIYCSGPFPTRHEAVTSALMILGVACASARRGNGANYRHGKSEIFPATN